MEPALAGSPLLQHWTPRSVLILRALQLGDMLCAVPALRALRQQLPGVPLTLLGLPWAQQLLPRFAHLLDEVLEFPGYPGLPERTPDLEAWPDFVQTVRERRYDLVLQMHGSGQLSNAIAAQLGGMVVAGFHPASEAAPGPYFCPWPERGHEAERVLALPRFLGAATRDSQLQFPLLQQDRDELQRSGLAAGLPPGGYLCVHAGARDPRRRWPVELFARLGDALWQRWQLPLVFTGCGAERELAASIIARLRAPAVNAAADISIGAMAALLQDSALLICNDTGVSHIAAGLRLPSVVIFRCSEVERWAPADQSLHRGVMDAEGRDLPQVLQQAHALLQSLLQIEGV